MHHYAITVLAQQHRERLMAHADQQRLAKPVRRKRRARLGFTGRQTRADG